MCFISIILFCGFLILDISIADTSIITSEAEYNYLGSKYGNHEDTHESDDIVERIYEEQSGFPLYRSYLSHVWTFSNIPQGKVLTFNIEAYRSTYRSDDDHYVFWYSTTGEMSDFWNNPMVTVTKTLEDKDVVQTYEFGINELPPDFGGTIYIKVTDANQSYFKPHRDNIYIDHMYIESKCDVNTIPATLIVGPETNPDAQFYSIQEAVDESCPGDTIQIMGGTYHETITINTKNLTIEAYDPQAPPVIDGADPAFDPDGISIWEIDEEVASKPGYEHEKIYRLKDDFRYTWSFPLKDETETFNDDVRKKYLMQIYEDDALLRGYKFSGVVGKLLENTTYTDEYENYFDDLDPAMELIDEPSDGERPSVRMPGRFRVQDDIIYVWSAHADDDIPDSKDPNNYKYYIPSILNLFEIKAPDVTLKNLVLKHSVSYAVVIEDENADGAIIEGCYFINTPEAIYVDKADDVTIKNNFIRTNGLYERYYYYDHKNTQIGHYPIRVKGFSNTETCKIEYNVISGGRGIVAAGGVDMTICNNIISNATSVLVGSVDIWESSVSADYNHNLKIYNNILHSGDEGALCIFDVTYGDIWIYRNLVYSSAQAIKDGAHLSVRYTWDVWGVDDIPHGRKYIYNNTFAFLKDLFFSYDHSVFKDTIYRNNIFHYRWPSGSRYIYDYRTLTSWGKDFFTDETSNFSGNGWEDGPDLNYNLYWKDKWDENDTLIAFFKDYRLLTTDPYYFYSWNDFTYNTKLEPDGIETNPLFNDNDIATTLLWPRDNDPGGAVYLTDLDNFSHKDYRDIIGSLHLKTFREQFDDAFATIFNHFDVQSNPQDCPDGGCPVINNGYNLSQDWGEDYPGNEYVTDGAPDIGAKEY